MAADADPLMLDDCRSKRSSCCASARLLSKRCWKWGRTRSLSVRWVPVPSLQDQATFPAHSTLTMTPLLTSCVRRPSAHAHSLSFSQPEQQQAAQPCPFCGAPQRGRDLLPQRSDAVALPPPRSQKGCLQVHVSSLPLPSRMHACALSCSLKQTSYRSLPTEPTPAGKPPSMALALQRLFCRLQKGDESQSTAELLASFGWDRSAHAYVLGICFAHVHSLYMFCASAFAFWFAWCIWLVGLCVCVSVCGRICDKVVKPLGARC